MPSVIYGINSGSTALAAATVKSVLGIRAGAAFGLQLKYYEISFDGVTASAVPVYVEIGYCTFATNSTPGTANTNLNSAITQRTGRTLTNGMTAMGAWTSEPTVITTFIDLWLDPNKGAILYDFPLGDEPDSALNEGFVIRCTAPAAVNIRTSLRVARI